jgi:hypothetical protein
VVVVAEASADFISDIAAAPVAAARTQVVAAAVAHPVRVTAAVLGPVFQGLVAEAAALARLATTHQALAVQPVRMVVMVLHRRSQVHQSHALAVAAVAVTNQRAWVDLAVVVMAASKRPVIMVNPAWVTQAVAAAAADHQTKIQESAALAALV